MDRFMDLLETTVTSPWVYAVIVTVALLDAFFPVVPSETLVVAAGVFAASLGSPKLIGIVAAAAAGAFVGDHISYAIGRGASGRLSRWANGRHRTRYEWAQRSLEERGGMLLVVARYVPGGRTAMTLTMGAVGFPLRRFAAWDLLAATSWALYGALLGYVGGAAFEEEPIKGVVLGIGLALGISLAMELTRHVRARARTRAAGADEVSAAGRDRDDASVDRAAA
jgi:membrane protein DedA with SNARE-associated domain